MGLPTRYKDLRLLGPGVTPVEGGCHFSVWAPRAEKIVIHLFDAAENETGSFPLTERRGGVWLGYKEGLQAYDRYAIEALGTEDPERGTYFRAGRLLVDPYAHILSRPFVYDEELYLHNSARFIPKCVIPPDPRAFDWQGVDKPNLDRKGLILYEANVRGLTRLNPDIPAEYRGTYLGLSRPEVIAHLLELGVTGIQLNPVAASMSEPFLVKRGLTNYWGYNPVCFMCPDPRFAVDRDHVLDEFRVMVRELHRAHIAVILDVVFNHTAEGGLDGPVVCYKGLDNHNFYAFEPKSDGSPDYTRYANVTGCGNSFDADNPVGLNIIIDSLRWWLQVMRVDGFRFDLAVTVFRETHGQQRFSFVRNSAFSKVCFSLDELTSAILIAEPWDVGPEGYRVGQFPYGWSEQNDRFRDTVRRFWRGDGGLLGGFATRIMGSRDIFEKGRRSINSSVNYVTYHDGMTLQDLVSYSDKHNEANGDENRDGAENNYSCNYGVEGPTDNPEILRRRELVKRDLIASCIIAQGLPHLLAGDEFSHSQQGNNNAYCQDNEISWIKWERSAANLDFIRFIGRCTQLRKRSDVLSELNLEDDLFLLKHTTYQARWFLPNGRPMKVENWNDPAQNTVMLTVGNKDKRVGEQWILLVNQSANDVFFSLPEPPAGMYWSAELDTLEADGVPRRFSDRHNLQNVCGAHALKVLFLKPAADGVREALSMS